MVYRCESCLKRWEGHHSEMPWRQRGLCPVCYVLQASDDSPLDTLAAATVMRRAADETGNGEERPFQEAAAATALREHRGVTAMPSGYIPGNRRERRHRAT